MLNNSNGKQNGGLKLRPKDYGGKQTTTNSNQSKQGGQYSFSQTTSKTSRVDKKTGGATNKEVNSTRETFKEKSTGRVVYKDEYKSTSTYKVGDKNGYTEYHVEKKIVNYGGSVSSNEGKIKHLK